MQEAVASGRHTYAVYRAPPPLPGLRRPHRLPRPGRRQPHHLLVPQLPGLRRASHARRAPPRSAPRSASYYVVAGVALDREMERLRALPVFADGPLAARAPGAQGPPRPPPPEPPRLRRPEPVPPLGHRLSGHPPRRRPRDPAARADPPPRRPRRRGPRLARPHLQGDPGAGDGGGLRNRRRHRRPAPSTASTPRRSSERGPAPESGTFFRPGPRTGAPDAEPTPGLEPGTPSLRVKCSTN